MTYSENVQNLFWSAVNAPVYEEAAANTEKLVAAVRAEVLREVTTAIEAERLADDTGHPEDIAYERAIDYALSAVRRMADDGERGE